MTIVYDEGEGKAPLVEQINSVLNRELKSPETVRALLATTFKGLDDVVLMKQALMEGMIRGYTFKDFLQKNIYAIKYGNGYSLVTSIDDARKRGMKSNVVGTDAPVYTMTDEKTPAGIPKPESATVTVKRLVGGVIGDFTAQVFFDEYYKAGKTWSGEYKPSMWDTKPRTMLAKVAEMHALRKACPEELSQVYVEEELENPIPTSRLQNAKVESDSIKMGSLLKTPDAKKNIAKTKEEDEGADEAHEAPADTTK